MGARLFLAGLLWLASIAAGRAQDGAIDLHFAAGRGASDDVYAIAPLPGPSGGFLVAGHFTAFDGHDRWRLARLHADGSFDESFDPRDGTGAAPVTRVLALPEGQALIAGPFSRFNGATRRLVARLRADGSLDPAFDASGAFGRASGLVQALAALPDGRFVVGGRFDASGRGGKERGVVRLRPDGVIDEGFTAGLSVGQEGDVINAVAPLPGDKLLVAGQFSPAGNVARLEPGGGLDPTFHLAVREGAAQAMLVQPDGRIVVAFSEGERRWLARLEVDGALDPSFHADPLPKADGGQIETLALQADGCVLVGGSFHRWAGVRRDGLARLRPDGSLDPTFDPGAGIAVLPLDDPDETPEAAVRVLLPVADGRLLVAGRFDLYNGALCHNLARVFDGAH